MFDWIFAGFGFSIGKALSDFLFIAVMLGLVGLVALIDKIRGK